VKNKKIVASSKSGILKEIFKDTNTRYNFEDISIEKLRSLNVYKEEVIGTFIESDFIDTLVSVTYNEENDKVIKTHTQQYKPLITIRNSLKQKVNNYRTELLNRGVEASTTANNTAILDTATDRDIINITAMGANALFLSNINSNNHIDFRDSNNITHKLTPQEMLTMSLSVSNKISQIYKYSWNLKDIIDSASIEELLNLDIYSGWPS